MSRKSTLRRLPSWAVKAVCFVIFILTLSVVNGEEISLLYPKPFTPPTWLTEKQPRLLFDVWPEKIWADQQVNIACAGTNASPFYYIWAGKDRIYHFETGQDCDVERYVQFVTEGRKLGVKTLCPLIRFWHPQKLLVEHPEWQERYALDAPPRKLGDQDAQFTNGCWISPFGDFYIAQSVHFAKVFGFEGYNLDGFGTFALCYCRYCQDLYKKDTGEFLPANRNVGSLACRRFMRWKLNQWTDFVYRWQKAVKEISPEFAAIPWSTGPGRWLQWGFAGVAECSDAANRLLDAPLLELFWDFPPDLGNNLLPSFVLRYYRGLTAERPVLMLPYMQSHGQQPPLVPMIERDFRLLTVVTNGATPALGYWQLGADRSVQRYNDLLMDREAFTTKAESIKWAAMLVSENSRLFGGISDRHSKLDGPWIGSGVDTSDVSRFGPNQRRLPAHMESAIGVFRACVEAHLPIDVITDQDVTEGDRLNLYKVLILPNTICLSDVQLANIQRFVAAGGGLVAMHESSLSDEFGTPRSDFGLAELFQASYAGNEDHTAWWPHFEKTARFMLRPHYVTDASEFDEVLREENSVLDFIGFVAKIRPKPQAEVLGVYGNDRDRLVKARDENRIVDGTNPFLLAVNENVVGGRVVYFSGAIGQSNFISPYHYQRQLLARSIMWVCRENVSPIAVHAPMCVQTNFFAQRNGKRLIVHLLNEINTSAGRALPEGGPPAREEVVPISGIQVVFHGQSIKQVRLEPEGIDLNVSQIESKSIVTIPKLRLHSMVVAEVD
jgi:hypothetical protein